MELHVKNVLVLKMPIILISVDNAKDLLDFDKMCHVTVDIVFESTDPRSKAIGDMLEKKLTIIQRLALDRLNEREDDESEEYAAIRLQAAVNVIRQMNVRTGMIISHDSLFNSWDPESIKDEWNVIPMS